MGLRGSAALVRANGRGKPSPDRTQYAPISGRRTSKSAKRSSRIASRFRHVNRLTARYRSRVQQRSPGGSCDYLPPLFSPFISVPVGFVARLPLLTRLGDGPYPYMPLIWSVVSP